MATVVAGVVSALVPRHCFGALGARPQGLCWADESTLAYITGQSVCLFSPDTKAQRFLAGSPDATVTAFAVCPARRLLALAERGDKSTVTVFDTQTLKRRKILTAGGDGTKEFVSVAISSDGRLLLAQGGAPDWTLFVWAWEKSKLQGSVRTATQPGHSVVQCLFQPGDNPQHVSVVGDGTCCVYRLEQGGTLHALPSALARREGGAYTCHAWLMDNDADGLLAVGTGRGEVLVVADGELRQTLALQGGCGAEALAACGKGFVAGTSHGMLVAFERDNENKPYRLSRSFAVAASSDGGGGGDSAEEAGPAGGLAALSAAASSATLGDATPIAGGALQPPAGPAASRACSLAASPVDGSIACLTSDAQLLSLVVAAGERRGTFIGLQCLAPAFHCGEITGLAACVRRAVVGTSGVDRTIRIWNYRDKSCELVQAFEEDVLSLALHPTGYMLLAGFANKLRLMMVLSDGMHAIKDLPIKAVRDCCFSNGGQYFAAANGNTVHVYCAYTAASVAVLRGHNGKVRGLWWSSDDAMLVTAGMDGAVYEWRVLEGRRVRDFVQKGWNHSCVSGTHLPATNAATSASAVSGGASSIFAATLDRKLRSLEECSSGGLQVAAEVEVGAVVTHVQAPGPGGRLLFAACDDGAVRTYKLPLGPASAADCQALRCGGGAVTRLAATRDESLLFAATAEGCLLMFDVKERDASRFLMRKDGEALPFAEEVLVARGDIQERRDRMAELEAQVAEVTAQNEYQLKLRDLASNEKVRQLTDKAASEAADAAQRYNALLADRTRLEQQYEARLRAAEEASAAQLLALDLQFQAKLVHEMEKLQELGAAKEALNAKWGGQTRALVDQHARVVAELSQQHQAALAAERARHDALASDKAQGEREAAEAQRQVEEDVDREVEELKERYRKQLQVEGDALLRLKGENGVLRKRFDEQQRAIEQGRAQLRLGEEERRQLQGTIEGLQRDVAALQRDVAGRDQAIGEKEKRMLDLKHKAQELEKFKFVLEYSIGELRAALDPKDVELAAMREQVQGLEARVLEARRGHDEARLQLEGRRQREAAARREAARQQAALGEAAAKIRHMQCDIQLAAEKIQAPDQLKAAVVKLAQAHASPVRKGGSTAAAAAVDGSAGGRGGCSAADASEDAPALRRQVDMLERSTQQLRASLEAEKRSSAANQRRMVAENTELLRQLREAQGGDVRARTHACQRAGSPSRQASCSGAHGAGTT